METKKRTSVRKRLLAWLLTVAMVCTSISVPTFAEEIVFDDAMTVDLAEELTAEGTGSVEAENLDELDYSAEVLPEEETFDDLFQEEGSGFGANEGLESIEVVPSGDDADNAGTADPESGALVEGSETESELGEEEFADEYGVEAVMLDDDVDAQAETPKFIVTMNLSGWAEDANSTELPYLKRYKVEGDIINISNNHSYTISNYPAIKDRIQLDYVEVDGVKFYYSDFEKNSGGLAKVDSSKCTNLNGREVQIGLASGQPKISFRKDTGKAITEDITLNFVFKTGDDETTQKNLTVSADESCGKIYEVKYMRPTDDKKGSVYTVYVRPKNGYQLLSYKIGEKEVLLNLTEANYVYWLNPADNQKYICNNFDIEIQEDTSITLQFAQASMELEFYSHTSVDSSNRQVDYYWYAGRFDDEMKKQFDELAAKTALMEDAGAKFWFKINVKGFLENGTSSRSNTLKMYKGSEQSEENLIFDSTDPEVPFIRDDGLDEVETAAYSLENDDLILKEDDAKLAYNGGKQYAGYAYIGKCPALDNITLVLDYAGYHFEKTATVQMAEDLPQINALKEYYTQTYGLDKMGEAPYTAEEKQSNAYATYCQYKNFRYVLRRVYQNQLIKIAGAKENERDAALAVAKQALADASVGKGCNAVVWNFQNGNGTTNIPVMVAVPNTNLSASETMCAALEALYPGNWSYRATSTMLGLFVNSVTAGGAEDTGKLYVSDGSNGTGSSYGFWYYNGGFSNYGISNYTPYDGDVMWWGGGDVDKNWNWALLRLKFGGDAGLATALAERGESKSAAALTAEELQTIFADLGENFFRRYGQFRDVSKVDMVEMKIGHIGIVTPDSGSAIAEARAAYDALSSKTEKDAVSNYQTLLDAEAAYAALLAKATVTYSEAMSKNLQSLSAATLGVGSTKGEWAILSLARRGLISGKDASGQAANYLKAAQAALEAGSLGSTTDYARVTLALSSLGVTAPEELIKQCEDYDKAISQGINAAAFALLALDSKPYDTANTAIREKYISYMLSHVCKNGGWVLGDDLSTADADVTAMVIQALAPYYQKRTDVKTAVDNGLEALKTMQKVTGGFASFGTYNAESTAQVIVALTSLGIDPTTWNNHDAVDALLHFYSTPDSKFAHTLGGDVDQMATEQATYALVAYWRLSNQKSALYQMSDVFGASGSSADPAQAVASAAMAVSALGEQTVAMEDANTEAAILSYVRTTAMLLGIDGPEYEVAAKTFTAATAGTAENKDGVSGSFTVTVTISMNGAQSATVDVKGVITPTKYVDPKAPITVKFSLYGDEQHEVNKDSDLHTYQFNAEELVLWIPETTVTVAGDATVGDVFKQIVDANGFTYKGWESNYVSSITNTKNGVTLTEFDNTSKSGWMYMVNGVHCGVGLNSQKLKDGDKIIWHWTDEYRLEGGSEMYNPNMVTTYIENLINEIGELESTPECKKAIEQARAAYNKLSDESKAKISNYEVLTKAEDTVAAPNWCWHEYDEGTITKKATCTAEGEKTYTCSKCGTPKKEVIPKEAHQAGAWTETKAVTCTADGEKVQKCTVCGETVKTETIKHSGHQAGTWTETKATCTASGEKVQKCTVCGETLNKEIIPALGHKFGAWTTVSKATVKAAEVQQHTCSVCGTSETQNVGSKLTAVLELPGKLTSFNMKKGDTKALAVTMANGDSVKSVKSDAEKTLKASLNKKTGKITLKALKTGKAKLTIKLDSGKSRKYAVKVVSGTVKTSKLTVTSVSNKKLTLKKGKTHTLKTEVKPFTSTQKVTYKTSNKKVATVTSAGKIKAVAPGKATITAKSGSKSVKITVTVPGIANVKSSVSLKKNKTLTLKPKTYGISGKVTYTSSNKKVATVTSKGKIKGIKKGTAKITVQAGSYKQTVTVKVK